MALDGEHHLAVLGELDRVLEQIAQDLPQPHRIAGQARRDVGLDSDAELEPFFMGLQPLLVGDALDQIFEIELLLFEAELAAFDLGEVEDYGDEVEQRAAVDQHRVNVSALVLTELGLG